MSFLSPFPPSTSVHFYLFCIVDLCQLVCMHVWGGGGDTGMEGRAFGIEKKFGNDWSPSFTCTLKCCYQHCNFVYGPCLHS